jgi:hypothetical protein
VIFLFTLDRSAVSGVWGSLRGLWCFGIAPRSLVFGDRSVVFFSKEFDSFPDAALAVKIKGPKRVLRYGFLGRFYQGVGWMDTDKHGRTRTDW